MHHPRMRGSDLGLLIESEIETGTGSPLHLKIGNGIGPGIAVEEVAVLALGPGPSLQRGSVTFCSVTGEVGSTRDASVFAAACHTPRFVQVDWNVQCALPQPPEAGYNVPMTPVTSPWRLKMSL